uniref:Uncharacterized protein n=1 Tax=Trichogramma kaykai TaxID=54128 RepID=A0ABD2WPT8_9HYME
MIRTLLIYLRAAAYPIRLSSASIPHDCKKSPVPVLASAQLLYVQQAYYSMLKINRHFELSSRSALFRGVTLLVLLGVQGLWVRHRLPQGSFVPIKSPSYVCKGAVYTPNAERKCREESMSSGALDCYYDCQGRRRRHDDDGAELVASSRWAAGAQQAYRHTRAGLRKESPITAARGNPFLSRLTIHTEKSRQLVVDAIIYLYAIMKAERSLAIIISKASRSIFFDSNRFAYARCAPIPLPEREHVIICAGQKSPACSAVRAARHTSISTAISALSIRARGARVAPFARPKYCNAYNSGSELHHRYASRRCLVIIYATFLSFSRAHVGSRSRTWWPQARASATFFHRSPSRKRITQDIFLPNSMLCTNTSYTCLRATLACLSFFREASPARTSIKSRVVRSTAKLPVVRIFRAGKIQNGNSFYRGTHAREEKDCRKFGKPLSMRSESSQCTSG